MEKQVVLSLYQLTLCMAKRIATFDHTVNARFPSECIENQFSLGYQTTQKYIKDYNW